VNGRGSFNTRVGSLVLFTTISGLRYYRGRRSADRSLQSLQIRFEVFLEILTPFRILMAVTDKDLISWHFYLFCAVEI